MNIECCADTLSGPLLLYKSSDRSGPEMLRVAGCAVRLHLLVERGGRESTRDLQIFRVTYHPGKHFLEGQLPALHDIVERPDRNRQIVQRNLFFFRGEWRLTAENPHAG
jgi:hypothetical protein